MSRLEWEPHPYNEHITLGTRKGIVLFRAYETLGGRFSLITDLPGVKANQGVKRSMEDLAKQAEAMLSWWIGRMGFGDKAALPKDEEASSVAS